MRVHQTSFGSRSGLWFRRQKSRSSIGSNASAGAATPREKENDQSVFRHDYESASDDSASVTTVELLDSTYAIENSQTPTVRRPFRISLSPEPLLPMIAKQRQRPKKTFASLKRLAPPHSAGNENNLQTKKKTTRKSQHISEGEGQQHPAGLPGREEGEASPFPLAASGNTANENTELFVTDDKENVEPSRFVAVVASATLHRHDSQLSFKATEETSKMINLSSKSSPGTIKRFFDRLDNETSLTLDTKLESPVIRNPIVRTRRNLARNKNPMAAEEYNTYTKVCHETGVQPISLEAFLENPGTFSSAVLYDGFLDEK